MIYWIILLTIINVTLAYLVVTQTLGFTESELLNML